MTNFKELLENKDHLVIPEDEQVYYADIIYSVRTEEDAKYILNVIKHNETKLLFIGQVIENFAKIYQEQDNIEDSDIRELVKTIGKWVDEQVIIKDELLDTIINGMSFYVTNKGDK